jgi:antitoxin ChpS
MTPAELDELLRPPTDAEAARALARFADDVKLHYGDRLKGLYLFGSRARGDHAADSDADVAVVLANGDWEEWLERRALNGLAFDAELDDGLVIQPWPFAEADWTAALGMPATTLLGAACRDAVPLEQRL